MCVSPQSAEFDRSMQKMVELGLAIARGETSSDVFLQYAEAMWNVRDLQATVEALDAALGATPPLSTLELSKAYASRSLCFLQMGDSRQALIDATRSLELMERAHPYGLRALVHLHLGQRSESLHDIEQAGRLDADDWEVRAWRGEVYLEIGRYAEAIDEFTWVLDTGECHRYASEVYLGRARAHQALGEPEAAADDCDHAIEEDYHEQSHWPFIVRSRARNAHRAYLLRAEARLALGDLPGALGDCCFAATIVPGDASVYELRGRVYHAIGNTREELRDLVRASHLRSTAAETDATSEPVLVTA